jgi:hypothetical protein
MAGPPIQQTRSGEFDHFAALNFFQGLLVMLKDSGHAGLVLVLDEIEALQRVRSDAREKGLNALRQFIDEIDSGRFPGLFLIITGTPSFFYGQQGGKKLATRPSGWSHSPGPAPADADLDGLWLEGAGPGGSGS